MSLHKKVYIKCAKQENNRAKRNIEQMCTFYKLKNCSIVSWLWILKNKNKSICHRTTFYSIFNMCSCRKPEIQNDLPNITKLKWICYF